MDTESKTLRFDERSIQNMVRDEIDAAAKQPLLRGMAVFKDGRGNVLMIKKNLIVHRGRTYVLESLFKENSISGLGLTGESTTPFVADEIDRSIFLFGIGTGGVTGPDPFAPDPPQPENDELATIVPFRTVPTGTGLSSLEDTHYYGMNLFNTAPGTPEGGEDKYWLKRLNLATSFIPEWDITLGSHMISMKMTLDINQNDARSQGVNELALYMANKVAGGTPDPDFAEVEMFSRITFATEMLSGTKEITIEYYIFA